MTQQIKIDDEQAKAASQAATLIGQCMSWDDTPEGTKYWGDVRDKLQAIGKHATTDGKPYVEPEPPIPDGYRLAVAGDEGRKDCKFWSKFGEWDQRFFVGREFEHDLRYIVPADRTPTDEEAKSRPEVMVRNRDDCKWQKYTLLAVFKSRPEIRFLCLYDNGSTYATWKQCRHLYPGE